MKSDTAGNTLDTMFVSEQPNLGLHNLADLKR